MIRLSLGVLGRVFSGCAGYECSVCVCLLNYVDGLVGGSYMAVFVSFFWSCEFFFIVYFVR